MIMKAIKKLWLFFMFINFLLFLSTSVIAAPSLSLKQLSTKISNDYDTSGEVVADEPFSVSHKKDPADIVISFSSGISGNPDNRYMDDGTGNRIYYQIYDNAVTRTVLKEFTGDTSSPYIYFYQFPDGNQTVGFTFTVVLLSNQVPLAGNYTDSITVSLLYDDPVDSWTEVDSGSVSIESRMRTIVEISIVDTGAPFNSGSTGINMDFGTLSQGLSLSKDVITRANTFYSISVESSNAGVMANMNATDPSVVPYVYYFDGGVRDLSSGNPVIVVSGSSPTDEIGLRSPVTIEIGDLGSAYAGDYEDVISISVSAD
jgi:hypothetical protein